MLIIIAAWASLSHSPICILKWSGEGGTCLGWLACILTTFYEACSGTCVRLRLRLLSYEMLASSGYLALPWHRFESSARAFDGPAISVIGESGRENSVCLSATPASQLACVCEWLD